MNSITVNITGFDKIKDRIASAKQRLAKDVDDVLKVNAEHIATKAKQLAPKDEGNLAGSISAVTGKPLEKTISVNAPYAAFSEFGTGKYAAEYVASLPEDWQTFARSFKGQKGGTFAEMILALTEWVHRHNIAGTYSVKTQRRTGSKAVRAQQDKQLAYLIARKILRDGIRAQPFLFPAFNEQQPIIIKNIEALLKEIF